MKNPPYVACVERRHVINHLLAAAYRACDHHGDGEAAWAAMQAECLALPTHLRPDLLAHFQHAYPESAQ